MSPQLRAITILLLLVSTTGTSGAFEPTEGLRRPVALARVGELLLVAGAESGSVSVVSTTRRVVVAEVEVGRGLSDVTTLARSAGIPTPTAQPVLALDSIASRGILLQLTGLKLEPVAEFDLPGGPRSALDIAQRRLVSVTCTWARQVVLLRSVEGMRLERQITIDLPFAPGLQVLAPDGRHLVVADCFAGRLAVIDLETSQIASLRSLDGHNIRGLAITPGGKGLAIAHQVLAPTVPTSRSRVFWGSLLQNVLRTLPLDDVLSRRGAKSPQTVRALRRFRLEPLGESGRGAGDPGAVTFLAGGVRSVLLSGVSEVSLQSADLEDAQRVAVGTCPTASIGGVDGSLLWIACKYEDLLVAVDVAERSVVAEVSLGPTPPLDAIARGEQLFFDARLSLDGWYSCQSCHTDGHSNGLLNDGLSDGSYGTPKRILSLLGTEDSGPWAWDGHVGTLRDQVEASLETTLRGEPPRKDAAAALTAYLRTLAPPPGVDLARGRVDLRARDRGEAVFNRTGCRRCHRPFAYTAPFPKDVGFVDEAGTHRFSPPSLRGVSQRDRLFHDNRAGSLREAIDEIGHGHDGELDGEDLEDLLRFLRQL